MRTFIRHAYVQQDDVRSEGYSADSEKVARALEVLLTDIKQNPPRMLGDGPILRFSLEPLA